jgi:hypothetical protein
LQLYLYTVVGFEVDLEETLLTLAQEVKVAVVCGEYLANLVAVCYIISMLLINCDLTGRVCTILSLTKILTVELVSTTAYFLAVHISKSWMPRVPR